MNASAAQRPPLLLSRLDAERIEELLEQPQYRSLNTDALRGELERAEVVEPADLPRDVISMNSTAQVRVEDAELGVHEHELTLVYPRDADGSANKVSIFAQELKTAGPMSPKRLDEKIAEIERMT